MFPLYMTGALFAPDQAYGGTQMKQRICLTCGNTYDPDSPSQLYCQACGIQRREAQRKARNEKIRLRRLEERRQNRLRKDGTNAQ